MNASWLLNSVTEAKTQADAEAYALEQGPYSVYRFAKDIKQRRWPEGEKAILKFAGDPNYAFWYARDVINGRWPEAEPIIMADLDVWQEYLDWLMDL